MLKHQPSTWQVLGLGPNTKTKFKKEQTVSIPGYTVTNLKCQGQQEVTIINVASRYLLVQSTTAFHSEKHTASSINTEQNVRNVTNEVITGQRLKSQNSLCILSFLNRDLIFNKKQSFHLESFVPPLKTGLEFY